MNKKKLLSVLLGVVMVFAMMVPAMAAEENTLLIAPAPAQDLTGKLVIIHTNDSHGRDVAVEGESIGTAGVAALKADIEAHNASFAFVCEEVTSENCGLRRVERFISSINEMEQMNRSEKCRRGWFNRKKKKEVC